MIKFTLKVNNKRLNQNRENIKNISNRLMIIYMVLILKTKEQ